jgi:hyperosmotically inducible protein
MAQMLLLRGLPIHSQEQLMRVAISGILVVCTLTLSAKAQAAADPWLTAKVKMELWSTKGIPSTRIMVDTNDGAVTLYGKVPSQADRKLAQQAARKVKGVTSVNDLLQVVPKSEEKEIAATDSDIKTSVEAVLKNDTALAGKISVKSVDKGVVLLSGSATSFLDSYEAQADAYFVGGVHRVVSEIKAPETFVVEEWSFFAPSEAATGSSHQVTSDAGLTTAVKEKLSADAEVPSTKIYVDTNQGTVALFGIVANDAQKMAAEKDAKAVNGVKTVDNQLDVKAMAEKEPAFKDEAVAIEVRKLLTHDKELGKVNVDVTNGVVKLTGKAPSSWQRAHAALLSREAKGAHSVDNMVQVSKN